MARGIRTIRVGPAAAPGSVAAAVPLAICPAVARRRIDTIVVLLSISAITIYAGIGWGPDGADDRVYRTVDCRSTTVPATVARVVTVHKFGAFLVNVGGGSISSA